MPVLDGGAPRRWKPLRENLPLRVILELIGGPMDGTSISESMVRLGEAFQSYEQAVVQMAFYQTDGGKVGQRFSILSPGRTNRSIVLKEGETVAAVYRYEITDRLEGDQELMLRAAYIGDDVIPVDIVEA